MRTFLTILILVLLATGCANDEVLRAAIEKDLRTSLSTGDSRAKVEALLQAKQLGFSFDEFNRRYQIRIDPKDKRIDQRVIMVYIYLDEAMCFKEVEVKNSYTLL
jgi:hypothetical protein